MKPCYVLLLGRKGAGKTSIAAHLVDQNLYRVAETKLEQTRDGLGAPVAAFRAAQDFTVVDCRGLAEPAISQQSFEYQIQQILEWCLQNNVSHVNFVGLVSETGRTNRHDIEMFKAAVAVLGSEMLKQCAVILTRAEDYSTERLEQFKKDLQEHSESAKVVAKCNLGIFTMGMVDEVRLLETYPQADERQRVQENKHRRLNEMRKQLYDAILAHRDKPVAIKRLKNWWEVFKKLFALLTVPTVLALLLAKYGPMILLPAPNYQLPDSAPCSPCPPCPPPEPSYFDHAWQYATWGWDWARNKTLALVDYGWESLLPAPIVQIPEPVPTELSYCDYAWLYANWWWDWGWNKTVSILPWSD